MSGFQVRWGDELSEPDLDAEGDLRCPVCKKTEAMSLWADDGEADLADWWDCQRSMGGCGSEGALMRADDPTRTQNGIVSPPPEARAFVANVIGENLIGDSMPVETNPIPLRPDDDEPLLVLYGDRETGLTALVGATDENDAERILIRVFGIDASIDCVDLSAGQESETARSVIHWSKTARADR